MTDTEDNPELQHIGTDLHRKMEEFALDHTNEQFRQVYVDSGRRWGKTEAGELPNPRVEMRELKEEDVNVQWYGEPQMGESKAVTAEDMAEQLGCTVEELPEKIQAQMDYYMQQMQKIQQMFIPPRMNRAQRRAAKRKRGR